jgi:hypothetical protein
MSDAHRVERRRPGLLAVGAAAVVAAGLVVWFTTGAIVPPVFATRTPASMPAGRAPSKTLARGTEPLVQPKHFLYQGAFRLPQGEINGSSFAYGGTALAFNPAHNSLFVVGHDHHQRVAEVSIPAVYSSSRPRHLETASLLQPLTDATEDTLSRIGPNTAKIGGLLPFADRLYLTGYLYYDGAGEQKLSHFVSGTDLTLRGDARGPFRVDAPMAGVVSGYMGLVPPAWQDALGGPVLTGNCCLGVIGRTSFGPAAFTINPSDIGVKDPVPATPLVYYPAAHPTLGPWEGTNEYFNGTSQVTGIVFPIGSRSVLFFGRHGLGAFCYGPGTDSSERAGLPADGGVDKWCFDPSDGNKGTHAYPYRYYVWAYDANDLAAVKAGKKKPWDVKPYAVWPFSLPYGGTGLLKGAAYDPATGRVFVSQAYGDGELPVIHVYVLMMEE